MAKKNIKSILKSKTFWFGVLILANAVAGLFGFGEFEPGLDLQNAVEFATGTIIIALRLVTKVEVK